MINIFSRSFKVIKGHFEVTSGLIKYAPIELKFDVKDPFQQS